MYDYKHYVICSWKYVCRVDVTVDIRGTVERYAKSCAKNRSCTGTSRNSCSNNEADNCLCCTFTTTFLPYD